MSQGRKAKPEPSLFVAGTELYRHLPRAHFYARLDPILDLSFIYDLTRPIYAEKLGRPSLDPVVFFKAILVGFFENVVYATELEYRLADSLTLRKFLGYSLDERTPDESTLRKTRQKMPEEVFAQVFRKVLDQCQEAGLLKGRAVGTDSTLVDANASMDSLKHKTLGCTYEEYVLALRRQDQPEASREDAKPADKKRGAGKASNQDGESTTDPEARVMQHSDGHPHRSHRVDTAVDLETGVIVTAGAELANLSDQADFLERVDEAEAVLAERGLELVAVVADKGHHSGENLDGLEERAWVGLISSPRTERGAKGFQRADFEYDPETDPFRCPAGKRLRRRKGEDRVSKPYQARGSDCRGCPHFGLCTKSKTGRALSVPVHEGLILANRERGPGRRLPAAAFDPPAARGGALRLLQRVRRVAPLRWERAGQRAEEDADGGDGLESAPPAGREGGTWSVRIPIFAPSGRPFGHPEAALEAPERLLGGQKATKWRGEGRKPPRTHAWLPAARRTLEPSLSGAC